MNVNLKRGLLEGAAVAAICTGLVVVLFWRVRAENPFTSSNSSDVWLVAFSTGLLGFLVGAFRATPVRPKK
jgi:beta-lactamase regulating signal transducer with metallopeptidase domain